MSSTSLLFLICGLGLIGWVSARARAIRLTVGTAAKDRPHSLAGYHGWYVALWTVLPALIFLAVWSSLAPGLVTADVLADPAASALDATGMERASILSEARSLADGSANAAKAMLAAARKVQDRAGADLRDGVIHEHLETA